MAKKKNMDDNYLAYYSYILISKAKRTGLFLLLMAIFALVFTSIAHNLYTEREWFFLVVPIILVGLPLMFYPPSEEWAYKPWQAKPQKYERHYRD